MATLEIATPEWALPLIPPCRYKGAKGGRASGKSWFLAELLVEEMVANPDLQFVCVREIQKSLKFSAKKLIEDTIRKLGVSHLFTILQTEIRRNGGNGIVIFQGMQDHTADSIKSLEGFDRCWVEEAQSLSARSMELLLPTIRTPGSELWYSWNPDQDTDPVEKLFTNNPDSVVVHVNFTDNPFCPDEMKKEAARHLRVDPDSYGHVWLGEYNTKNEAQVLHGKWRVDELQPTDEDSCYFGADWGFSQDPSTLIKSWIIERGDKRTLYIEKELYKVGVEVVDLGGFFNRIPESRGFKIRADNARPELISHLRREGYNIHPCKKGAGSVEDGITNLRSFDEIVINPSCKYTIQEARLWSYKVDKRSGDILPKLVDANNHCWDAIRYALEWMIKPSKAPVMRYA